MADSPKFTVLHESMRGKSFDLNKDVMSIGRREGMDICIPDASLSGHHADLIRGEKNGKITYTLRDNDSTNGTKINGSPVTEQELKNSDVITLGAVEILFEGESDRAITRTTHTIDISNIERNISQPAGKLNPLDDQEAAHEKMLHNTTMIIGVVLGIGALAAAVYAISKLI